MIRLFGQLLGLIRFSHTVFALPFALTSAALAWQREPFRWVDLAGILLCMIFARSFAMAFNRVADRRFDAWNPRTANRHLPSGELRLGTVVAFMLACAAGFIAATLLFWLREQPNHWPVILSGPVLAFIAGYSLAKRFTSLAHVWLGASLMMAPIAAWIAIVGMNDLFVPVLIGLSVLTWVTGFDILYACQDVEFDRAAGLHSIPARYGVARSLRIAFVSHLATLVTLVVVGVIASELRTVYGVGLGLIAVVMLTQHRMVRADDMSRVNQAFFRVNAVVSLGLFAVVMAELMV